ncbi:von Willebrand factor type A [Planctomycetales bacterium 10988]|nr:von Willebrand factor type A [Planctomycetales bacterium 10988]
MSSAESYLKPEVIQQIKRLDLRAQFIVKGYLQGLHASPFHGFSVEFSEHRKYNHGDDPKDIDWLVYAKTDKYYIKKFEAETNITGYLVMDLSSSMAYTYRQQLTKFDYAICLAAALCYLMISQQDPVGLVTFDKKIRDSVPPRSRRSQLAQVLSLLTNLKPSGETNIAHSLTQLGAMLRHRSLIMIFSDLLGDQETILKSIRQLRHGGHDLILFHLLDEAEVRFPFEGMVEFEDSESHEKMTLDADGYRAEYLKEMEAFCEVYRAEAFKAGADYLRLDTSMPFDKALTEYLMNRRMRC